MLTIREFAKQVGCTVPVIYRLINEGIINREPLLFKGRYIGSIDVSKFPPASFKGFYKRGRPSLK